LWRIDFDAENFKESDMKPALLCSFILLVAAVWWADEPMLVGTNGPVLIASGDGYFIHAFMGAVTTDLFMSRTVGPGVVLFHTLRETGQATWLLKTGTSEFPTRRISFNVSRLVGLDQTEREIAAVIFESRRIYDRVPMELLPENGKYRLAIYDKKTGKTRTEIVLGPTSGFPEKVPDETAGAGVIQKTASGFTVLGNHLIIDAEGKIEIPSDADAAPRDK
jgi:hypothetical protein